MKFFDRIKETSTTSGTGDLTLAGSSAGFIAFQEVYAVGERVPYCVVDGSSFEVGLGTLTGTSTLERTEIMFTVVEGSTSTLDPIDLSVDSKDVFCTVPAFFLNQLPTRGQMLAVASGLVL